MDKKTFFWGAAFGFLAPVIGMFAGLQLAPFLGNILLFPFIILSSLVDIPFGEFSLPLLIFSFVLSIVLWGLIFVLITQLKRKVTSN